MPGNRPSQMTKEELDYAIKHRRGAQSSEPASGSNRPSQMSKEELSRRISKKEPEPKRERPVPAPRHQERKQKAPARTQHREPWQRMMGVPREVRRWMG